MENKSWVIRCLILFMLFQIFRGVLNVGEIFIYVLNSGVPGSNGVAATMIALHCEAICVGTFALPVVYALFKAKPYTGMLLDWYFIVFIWCIAIRQVVEFVYHKNSIIPILFTFVFNAAIYQAMTRALQRKHPQMCWLNE